MSDSLLRQDIVWIDSSNSLEKACLSWQSNKLLAIDTEFMRSNTYYPIAGLIQINDGEKNYLIDPVAIDDFTPLEEILVDDDIIKAIHSGSEDIEVFHHKLGFLPSKLFDTQIAGAMCGLGFSLGFANMIEKTMGVSLPKTQTRSDWLARPLSTAQKKYAAMDVEYLYSLAVKLIKELTETGRIDWAFVESKLLIRNFSSQLTPQKSYLRFKQAFKLNTDQLSAFALLCQWREELAQIKDKPRNHIIKEHILFVIAQKLPTHISQLRDIQGLGERFIKHYGAKIIDLISKSQSIPSDSRPPRVPKPLSSSSLSLVKQLRVIVCEHAKTLELAPELLMKKKDYEFVVCKYLDSGEVTFPDDFPKWRLSHVQNIVSDFLSSNNKKIKAQTLEG